MRKKKMQINASLTLEISLIKILKLIIMKLKVTLSAFILVLICTLIHRSLSQKLQQKQLFPRFIWVFWEGELSPLAYLCFNNMRHFAKQSGWQFTVLNYESFQAHLSDQTRDIVRRIKAKGTYTATKLSDVVRSFILYQKGGIWLDSTSLIVSKLDWLQKVEQQQFFYNKISKQPEIIFYTYNPFFGGNKTVIFDQDLQKQVYILPGLQNWIIISKPKSKFLTESIELFRINSLQKNGTEKEIVDEYIQQGYSYQQEGDQYYFFANFHTQTLIQKKQRQIDANPAAFNTKYAVEYYGIWLIRAQATAYKYILLCGSFLFIQKLFYQPDKQALDHIKFVKFNFPQRRYINYYLQIMPYFICLNIMDKMPNSSLIYKYALQFGSDYQEVYNLKRLYDSPQQICQSISMKIKISIILLCALFIALCYCLSIGICKLIQKKKKYGNFQKIINQPNLSL